MEDLSTLTEHVTRFVQERGLALVPVLSMPLAGVVVDDAAVTWEEFVELAHTAGARMLYLARQLDPRTPETVGADASRATGQVTIGFLAGGTPHTWSRSTAWYQEWLEADEAEGAEGGWGSPQDQQRIDELAHVLLAHREFRVGGDGREALARGLLPAGTPPDVVADATYHAEHLLRAAAQEAHVTLRGQYDRLAAELAASPAWTAATSAAERKQVTMQFLTEAADGYTPSAQDREVLYGRARAVGTR